MNQDKITQLFQRYAEAFLNYDVAEVKKCYQLPCSLNTPDKMLVIQNSGEFEQAFEAIFHQLAQANTSDIKALQASCISIDESTIFVCVDWAFINNEQDVFADFSAFYHLRAYSTGYKIIQVSSQDLSQSVTLPKQLNISSNAS